MNVQYLSLNQMTTERWNVSEAVDGCARSGLSWIGLWRHKVDELGIKESARLVRDAGVRVSSLCRGGMFPAGAAVERRRRIDDNKKAIEDAAELGTDVLVLVCGPAENCSLDDARKMVEDGIAELAPYAEEHGVKLGIEPLHPMFAGDRSVIVTLSQANDIVAHLASPYVGVVIDVYHVWWDPKLPTEIQRAAGNIYGFHVNDWLMPIKDALTSRGLMGDGCIEIGRITNLITQLAKYDGPVEVEIFNKELWSMDYEKLLPLMIRRFEDIV